MYAPAIRNLRDVRGRGLGIDSTSCSRQPSSARRGEAEEDTADLIRVLLLIYSLVSARAIKAIVEEASGAPSAGSDGAVCLGGRRRGPVLPDLLSLEIVESKINILGSHVDKEEEEECNKLCLSAVRRGKHLCLSLVF